MSRRGSMPKWIGFRIFDKQLWQMPPPLAAVFRDASEGPEERPKWGTVWMNNPDVCVFFLACFDPPCCWLLNFCSTPRPKYWNWWQDGSFPCIPKRVFYTLTDWFKILSVAKDRKTDGLKSWVVHTRKCIPFSKVSAFTTCMSVVLFCHRR